MPGLGIVIPRLGPGEGPVVPVELHSYGLSGATHRYAGSRLVGVMGNIVNAWDDAIGDHHAVRETSQLIYATGPLGTDLAVSTPNQVVSASINQSLQSPILDTTTKTTAIVYYSGAPASVACRLFVLNGLGYTISRAANGNPQMNNLAGGGNTAGGGASAVGWHLLIASADGVSEYKFNWDGLVFTGVYTPAAIPASTAGNTILNSSGTAAINVAIAEIITFPTVLSQADRALMRTALKAHYPVLP